MQAKLSEKYNRGSLEDHEKFLVCTNGRLMLNIYNDKKVYLASVKINVNDRCSAPLSKYGIVCYHDVQIIDPKVHEFILVHCSLID